MKKNQRRLKKVGLLGMLTMTLLVTMAFDFEDEKDFGDVSPGKPVGFTVNPPGTVTDGKKVNGGGFTDWSSSNSGATWNATVPSDFTGSHEGLFTGHYTVPGEEGGEELTWKFETFANTGDFSLGNVLAVRRRYGDKDPGKVTQISVQGEDGVEYTLKIQKTGGGDGDATFDKAGTKHEMSYTGTGEREKINLYGQLESTIADNIKIWGEDAGGDELDSDTFIVFSMTRINWSSSETQHKDTDAVCTKCDGQAGVPLKHRHDADDDGIYEPCDHGSFFNNCKHCAKMCWRCCMHHIQGKKQDFYKTGTTTTVEQNHDKEIWTADCLRYGFTGKINTKYKTLYKTLLEKGKLIQNDPITANHMNLILGCGLNTPHGDVTENPGAQYWEPTTAGKGWKTFNNQKAVYIPN